MICRRIELKGLLLWKADIKSFIKSMNVHERDVDVRYKLDEIEKVLEAFMERATLLELSIWKASCLGFSDDGFHSMQEIIDLGDTLHDFDPDEYKRDAHIKSGAEIIIPRVMSFLEDEPVSAILQQIK